MSTSAIHHAMTPLEWGLLLALSVLWGGSFFFTEVALEALPPLTLVVLRVGLAAIVLNLVVQAIGQRMPTDRCAWTAFITMGLLNNAIPFSLIVWGQTEIASGLAAILNATTPLLTVLVAHLLTTDERMIGNRLAGVVIGSIGVVLMIGPDVLGDVGRHVLGQVACLAAALSYAFAGVFGRRFRALGIDPRPTAAGQATASTMILLPLALIADHPWALAMPGPAVWGAVLGIALLSTALAYILYFRILATAGATNLLLVTLLIPVSAILLGALMLGERLAAGNFAGIGLIALGLAAIDGRPLGWLNQAQIALRPGSRTR